LQHLDYICPQTRLIKSKVKISTEENLLITDNFTDRSTVSLSDVLAGFLAGLLVVVVADLNRLLVADLLGLVQTDLLGLVPAHLARDVVADLDWDHLLHNLRHIPTLLLGDGVADLLADGVAFLGILVAGDLPVLADLLRHLPLYSVLHVAALLPGDIPATVHINSVALLLIVSGAGSLGNLSALLVWNIPAEVNKDDVTLGLSDRMTLCPWYSVALLTRYWPAVVNQDSRALLLHPGSAGGAWNIATLEGWLVLVLLGDIATAFLSDGGTVLVGDILAVLLGFLCTYFIHHSIAFSFLDGVADLGGDVLAIILSLFFTDLSGQSLALVHIDCRTGIFWNSLAILLGNLCTLLVSDGVADLTGHEVHHSPLLSTTVLHSVHHGHLDSVAHGLWHVGTLLVVHSVALGPGHHVSLGLILGVADIFKLGLTHGESLIMTNRLGDCVALRLVLRMTLCGRVHRLPGVATLLDHGVGTDVPGDSVALWSATFSNVISKEDINQEKGRKEDLHLKTEEI